MMETKTKTISGLIVLILASLTGNIYQYNLEDVPDNFTHICVEEDIITQISWCDHISGGIGTRCYQTESSRSDWKVCDTGWTKAELQQQKITYKKQRIICTAEGCK